jgi:O-antigen/teichoic acid export membrane protein
LVSWVSSPDIESSISSSPDALATNATAAVGWRFAGTGVGAVARFAIGVGLARLLSPSDFGIVALAMVVVAFAQPFGDFGIAGAVIQHPSLTDRHVRVAFTLATLLGFALTLALAISAPWAAMAAREARVAPVLQLLAFSFAIQGPAVVAGAILKRRLDFKRLFLIETFSYLTGYGAVALAMAAAGAGYWSLVAAALAQTAVSAVATLSIVRHSLRPLFANREAGELLRFGIGSGASTWVTYLAGNGDNFIVGRMLGAADLGLYTRAYSLMNLPYTYTASVMSGALFPAFAQIQGEPARLGRAYLTMTSVTALVAGPAMCVLAVVAPHLVVALYGPRWSGVAAPLQILCAAGYFRSLYHVGSVVAHSVGRVYSDLWRQVGYAFLVLVGALIGVRFGLGGVAAGVSVAILYMFLATGQLALQIVGSSWREYMRAQRIAFATTALTGLTAVLVRQLLERQPLPAAIVAAGTMAAAAITWLICTRRALRSTELQSVHAQLPPFVRRVVTNA